MHSAMDKKKNSSARGSFLYSFGQVIGKPISGRRKLAERRSGERGVGADENAEKLLEAEQRRVNPTPVSASLFPSRPVAQPAVSTNGK